VVCWVFRVVSELFERDAHSVDKHFVEVSTIAAKVSEFGIEAARHIRVPFLGWRALFDGLGDRHAVCPAGYPGA
jgi:hypothetical protein